jgi:hypothetical protein
MEYKGINESWKEYLETVQSKNICKGYPWRRTSVCLEGYQKGLKKRSVVWLAELLEKAEAGMEYEQLAIYVDQPTKSYSVFATDIFKENRWKVEFSTLEVGETFFKLVGKDKRICQFEKSDDSYIGRYFEGRTSIGLNSILIENK